MSTPTKENIATVVNGFEQFFEHMLKAQSFNLQEFVNFMEPKFTAAGYRETPTLASNNILILTEVAAGDFVVSSGAIREIRRLYPDAHITMLVYPRALELAEFCPYVDEIIFKPKNKKQYSAHELIDRYRTSMDIAKALLERRFDICFAFGILLHIPLIMYMSGSKIRVTAIDHESWTSFNNSNGLTELLMKLATHLFPYTAYGYHRADRFFSFLENLLYLPITNRKLEV